MVSDPNMLVSIINMKLRDGGCESLGDVCASMGIGKEELLGQLKAAGFEYFPEHRKFI